MSGDNAWSSTTTACRQRCLQAGVTGCCSTGTKNLMPTTTCSLHSCSVAGLQTKCAVLAMLLPASATLHQAVYLGRHFQKGQLQGTLSRSCLKVRLSLLTALTNRCHHSVLRQAAVWSIKDWEPHPDCTFSNDDNVVQRCVKPGNHLLWVEHPPVQAQSRQIAGF